MTLLRNQRPKDATRDGTRDTGDGRSPACTLYAILAVVIAFLLNSLLAVLLRLFTAAQRVCRGLS